MTESYTPTQLRQNLFRILDQVSKTGKPVEINRKGTLLEIQAKKSGKKLDLIKQHPEFMKNEPEAFVHIDWSDEWKP